MAGTGCGEASAGSPDVAPKRLCSSRDGAGCGECANGELRLIERRRVWEWESVCLIKAASANKVDLPR